jgi:hypothetical protein
MPSKGHSRSNGGEGIGKEERERTRRMRRRKGRRWCNYKQHV